MFCTSSVKQAMTEYITRSRDRLDLTNATARLERVLQDIARSVQISSDLTISHPEYDSLVLPAELQERFAQLPFQVQHDYLRVKLQQFLEDIYYLPEPTAVKAKVDENQTIEWSKSQFLRQLSKNNHGKGYFKSGWKIVGETESGLLQVCKDGLTLHVMRDRHLSDTERLAKIGDVVRVKLPPQLVEPGYYIAVGDAGSIDDLELPKHEPTVDLYLNLNSQGALALMHGFTTELNTIAIPFHFKVLYRSEDYIYSDTATLSFTKTDCDRLQGIIQSLYQKHRDYFQSETPLFSKYLAPGLSIAERPPIDLSLAQHRFGIIAEALIYAWQHDKVSFAERLECISDRFRRENVSLKFPYCDRDSEDIYTPILF